MNPVELASSVQRMLEAEGVSPTPELVYVFDAEAEGVSTTERIVVMPSNPESSLESRGGAFIDSIEVDIGIVRAVQGANTAAVAGLIDQVQLIMGLLKTKAPLDESDQEIRGAAPVRVYADPLYSQTKLSQGVFMGVIRVEYQLWD